MNQTAADRVALSAELRDAIQSGPHAVTPDILERSMAAIEVAAELLTVLQIIMGNDHVSGPCCCGFILEQSEEHESYCLRARAVLAKAEGR